ncbi:hypothetical protein P8625_10615 [Tenacibaculum tangerinum]|uniref:Uncharacterized protein n=1 Tax=Tenacibaculum tangerinum TaxID=3038772 RepID=A0ABY8KZA1_9FLAO|nr:hypothetical protein [Tenacibaculum tangerinum]WGH74544.1 hypothetical protein P8625_10615 [Tenacibaculum tangerinum]
MKKTHYHWLLPLILFTGMLFQSCEKDIDFIDTEENLEATASKSILFRKEINSKGAKKLKNPYALKNMKKSWENIKKKLYDKQIKVKGDNAQRLEEGVINYELSTTHYYVLLRPENAEQEALIKEDPNIHAFDYPLDYEFTDEYLDSRTPDNDSIPDYYTSIVLGQTLPDGVPSEILEELYIPEEDPFFDNLSYARTTGDENTKQGEIANGEDLLRHLLMEAYTLTDNEEELMPEGDLTNTWWIFGSKWYPSGNLKIWDDNAGSSTTTTKTFSHYEYYYCDTGDPAPAPDPDPLDPYVRIAPIDDNICKRAVYTYNTNTVQGKYIPLEGAQVLMRQWFTIRQGITDANGNFRTGSVRGKARYVIQWERYHYSIRNGSLFQAETRGPKTDNSWNHSIKGGDDEYHGIIHTAAHTYYYGNRFGLTSPPTNGSWRKQMKIAAREQNGTSSHVHQRRWIQLAQIHIKKWGEESQQVFGTTIHELAHAAHWAVDRSSYNNLVWDGYISDEVFNNAHPGDVRTLETWATTVEILFANSRYKDKFGQANYKYYFENRQNLETYRQPFYTSLGYDMIDNINQRSVHGSLFPLDRVSGYTINQLENALRGATSWHGWRDNIKAQTSNNPTENYVDELFNNWE